MEIYYYCSYTGSPVGYRIGRLEYTGSVKTVCSPDSSGIHPLIEQCFYSGDVLKAYGRLPDSRQYFLLVKKLCAKGADSADSVDYYINFALVTEDEREYSGWMSRRGADERQVIADKVRDTMQQDSKSDFGFSVRPDRIGEFAGMSFCRLFERVETAPQGTDSVYLELRSHQTDLGGLQKALGLAGDTSNCLEYAEGNWVQFRKKKLTHQFLWAAVLTAVVMALYLLTYLYRMTGLTRAS